MSKGVVDSNCELGGAALRTSPKHKSIPLLDCCLGGGGNNTGALWLLSSVKLLILITMYKERIIY